MPFIIETSGFHMALEVKVHTTADAFLGVALPSLLHHEASANIILAHALQCRADESISARTTASGRRPRGGFTNTPAPDCFWLTLWSSTPAALTLDIALSCLSWKMGNYPIFIWSPPQCEIQNPKWLHPRIKELAVHLVNLVPPRRVFSIFGRTALVETFAGQWEELTGLAIEPQPFYSAIFSHCTADTFKGDLEMALPVGHRMGLASMVDQKSVAVLCKEFADDSIFFPLSIERAHIEAEYLIMLHRTWVYHINGDAAALCAVTRTSPNVAAITKVYTTPKFRKLRCAERLVRMVTCEYLSSCQKVVLYVGNENKAQFVYDRVGFVGLCGKDKPEGVEDALELGFKGTDRGYW